jgi:serine/threonine protein kinase
MNSTNLSEILIRLTNFSMARRKDSSNADNRQTAISMRYCAPEILKSTDQSKYSDVSDVYSFDVLMRQACSQGKVSYESYKSDNDIRQRRVNDERLPN